MVKEEEYLLTNQEVLGGLKSAIERGQTLKQAMMSFYQAGYKKEEIEDAARAYLYLQKGVSEEKIIKQNEESKKELLAKKEKPKKNQKPKEEISKTKIENKENFIPDVKKTSVPMLGASQKPTEEPKKVVQKISNYDGKKMLSKEKGRILTIILVVTLLVLMGILGLVILFKGQLINFVNSLFG